MPTPNLHPVSLRRMANSIEKVQDRLRRAVAALEAAEVPYAVAGGNAVAAWVTRVDEAAVRFTQDVDILLRRNDLEAAKAAMQAAGFVYRHVKSIDMFLDGPDAKARDAVHVVFASEKVRDDSLAASPSMEETDESGDFRVVDLEALVRMKLTAYRDKDRTHLRDMIGVGLIDAAWPSRYAGELGDRLQRLLDDPEG